MQALSSDSHAHMHRPKLGYFWSDLEDNLLWHVIQEHLWRPHGTLSHYMRGHWKHGLIIFRPSHSLLSYDWTQIKVALECLRCINSLVLEIDPLPRTSGSPYASFWTTFLWGTSFYWESIEEYDCPRCICASSGVASLLTYPKVKIV
jgi:hypothetical protein